MSVPPAHIEHLGLRASPPFTSGQFSTSSFTSGEGATGLETRYVPFLALEVRTKTPCSEERSCNRTVVVSISNPLRPIRVSSLQAMDIRA